MTGASSPDDRNVEAAREAIDDQHARLDADLSAQFLLALSRSVGKEGLTPAALSEAATQVLPVDGAGLSILVNVLRLPLGASDDTSRRAEALQSTLGEGPCLEAAQAQATVVADAEQLETTWPLYAEELTATTPFRAVAAIPLQAPGHGVYAALDLYSTDTELSAHLDLDQAAQVATVISGLLATCIGQVPDYSTAAPEPGWYREASSRRHQVWIALGMIMATRGMRTRDALALLRAHAYSQGRSIDDVADDIAHHLLPPTDLT